MTYVKLLTAQKPSFVFRKGVLIKLPVVNRFMFKVDVEIFISYCYDI